MWLDFISELIKNALWIFKHRKIIKKISSVFRNPLTYRKWIFFFQNMHFNQHSYLLCLLDHKLFHCHNFSVFKKVIFHIVGTTITKVIIILNLTKNIYINYILEIALEVDNG